MTKASGSGSSGEVVDEREHLATAWLFKAGSRKCRDLFPVGTRSDGR